MALGTREVKRRVRSVRSIRQITRAMELVAAAKMQRAVAAVQQSRRYADLAWEVLRSAIAGVDATHHPLLTARPRRRLLLVLMASNRGLAGGFNSRVNESARAYLARARAESPGLQVEAVSLGRKARDYLLKCGERLAAEFERRDRSQNVVDISPLTALVFRDYQAGKYDAVAVVYTDFVSMLRQEPRVRELLPLREPDATLGAVGASDEGSAAVASTFTSGGEEGVTIFEPDRRAVLDKLVPRVIELQLYQALLESVASEHAARMLAMRNASEAAADLIADLTLTFNQLRQAGITRELSEISAGRLAVGA
jgi:F-type H+-transporting ATPase subunit gamma